MKLLTSIIVGCMYQLVLAPLCLMFTWNAIAWEFNFPQFGFWVPFGICLFHFLLRCKVTVKT